MRNNPRDWRIEDLKVVANKYSIQYRQMFVHKSSGLVTVPCARPIKPVYIRQFVALIDRLERTE